MLKKKGLYQTVITDAIELELRTLNTSLSIVTSNLREAEAADRLALHVSGVVAKAVSAIAPEDRLSLGTDIARKLVQTLSEMSHTDTLLPERPVSPPKLLEALRGKLPDGREEVIESPQTPLLDTTLLTNANGEPRIGVQLLSEIDSADRIDIVVAFIRRTGLTAMMDKLRRFCETGKEIRILTTTYTGSTEVRALDELTAIGARVKVSYDTGATRLHAKTWLFHRDSGYSTAYIGSSNLTYSAQTTGAEWNLRVSNARNPSVIEKVSAVFESYWNNPDFVEYSREEFLERTRRPDVSAELMISPVEIRLEPFQERLLEEIELAREGGHRNNLLVSATGTGKTVMAAVYYSRLKKSLPRARLLFIAHRQEILNQSLATFRHALRDGSFGELWVGGEHPDRFEHVFASIQSLGRTNLDNFAPDHFDIVIIDEFHHAAATSYDRLIRHLKPKELLGLTATPERSDGQPILDWFDGQIAAELRLWDAIEQHRLVPFAYYGINDQQDYRSIAWRNGYYDLEGLSGLLTGNDAVANLVIKEIDKHIDSPSLIKALGFCVSVSHAHFMADRFNKAGIKSVAISAGTSDQERKRAISSLESGAVNVVFSVDLFNEGVDVPPVDTLLMLRPTNSPTLFLQQLGRGLRKFKGKSCCTVLDFVGHHRKEFRFDRKLRALLGGTREDLLGQVKKGFPFLPAGCHMELDRKATEIVLESIKNSIPSNWKAKVDELRKLLEQEKSPSLKRFLESTGLEAEDIYSGNRRRSSGNRSWSELREDAGISSALKGPFEESLRRACGRLLHINDRDRIKTYRKLLESSSTPNIVNMTVTEQRYAMMLAASIIGQVIQKEPDKKEFGLQESLEILWRHPQVLIEIRDLLDVLEDRIEHVVFPLDGNPGVPLKVNGRYTRIEILAAFGVEKWSKLSSWREGVQWMEGEKADLLAFTLDKTSGSFSPTTRYRDYAISRDLIHWESQSTTRADSPTGRRYQNHESEGSRIMLFARHGIDDRAFYFLGPATYVKHESEMPMAITWRLKHLLPGDLFASFAAAVA